MDKDKGRQQQQQQQQDNPSHPLPSRARARATPTCRVQGREACRGDMRDRGWRMCFLLRSRHPREWNPAIHAGCPAEPRTLHPL